MVEPQDREGAGQAAREELEKAKSAAPAGVSEAATEGAKESTQAHGPPTPAPAAKPQPDLSRAKDRGEGRVSKPRVI